MNVPPVHALWSKVILLVFLGLNNCNATWRKKVKPTNDKECGKRAMSTESKKQQIWSETLFQTKMFAASGGDVGDRPPDTHQQNPARTLNNHNIIERRTGTPMDWGWCFWRYHQEQNLCSDHSR